MIMSLIFEKTEFSFDETSGLFGVFHEKWILKHLITAVVTAIFINFSKKQIFKQLSFVYYEYAIMFEPIIATFVAWLLVKNPNQIPDLLDWILISVIVIGNIFLLKEKFKIDDIAFFEKSFKEMKPKETLICNNYKSSFGM